MSASFANRTHGLPATYKAGCRCRACLQALTEQRWARLADSLANGGVYPGAIAHGLSGYTNHGCRCEACTASHAARIASMRQRRYAKTAANGGVAPTSTHNASTYINWGCRCDSCRAVSR